MVLFLLATTDEWEEICIVPVTEEVSMAIQSADFQSLLLSIGMQPPSDMVGDCLYLLRCISSMCEYLGPVRINFNSWYC